MHLLLLYEKAFAQEMPDKADRTDPTANTNRDLCMHVDPIISIITSNKHGALSTLYSLSL